MMQQQAASLQHGGALFSYYRSAAPTSATRTARQPVQHATPHTNVSTGTYYIFV